MRSRSSLTYARRFDRIRPLGSRPLSERQGHSSAKSVLLTRSEAVSRGLQTGLKARGRGLLVQRLLTTAPLPADIPDPGAYQGMIASSAVAVEILARQCDDRTCPLYVVGKASARAASAAGFDGIKTASTANDLSVIIRDRLNPADGPLLYVAGRHRARDMTRLLSGFEIDLVEVYAAEKVSRLTPDVRRALKRGKISHIAFYSARAASAFMAAASHGKVAKQARRTTALCLSPRIAAHLQARGWRRTWAARIPAADLIDARLLNGRAPQKPIAENTNELPPVNPTPSPAAPAVPEASMTSPAPTAPVDSGKTPPGWPAVIAVAVFALIFAAVAWYLSKDRVEGLQAEVAELRGRIGSLDLDPGKVERAAMVSRAEEAAKVSTALADVAAKAADKASVDNLAARLDALSGRLEASVSTLEQKTGKTVAGAVSAAEAAQKQSAAQAKTLVGLAAQVADLEERFVEVEAWTKGASPAQLAERLIALGELRRLLDLGAPFATALSRAAKSVPDVGAASGGWLDSADTGIRTYAQLSASLTKIEKQMPTPRSNASGNAVVDSALGVLFSGIQVEGKGALVDDPNRAAIAKARQALGDGDPAAANDAMSALTVTVADVDSWKADLAARMEADTAISAWEKKVLATVGESVQ